MVLPAALTIAEKAHYQPGASRAHLDTPGKSAAAAANITQRFQTVVTDQSTGA
jgi:hypothetical protein